MNITRKEFVTELYKYDTEDYKEWNVNQGKANYDIVLEGISYIKETLNISCPSNSSFIIKDDRTRCYESLKPITESQSNFFQNFIYHLNNNKIESTFHQLCDFINNTGDTLSITLTEKVYIYTAISLLENYIDKRNT